MYGNLTGSIALFSVKEVIPLVRAPWPGDFGTPLGALARKNHVWISTKNYGDKWLAQRYTSEMRNDRRCDAIELRIVVAGAERKRRGNDENRVTS